MKMGPREIGAGSSMGYCLRIQGMKQLIREAEETSIGGDRCH